MKYIVALTGGIASGKTTVANAFAELAVDIVDADIIARQVVAIGSYGLEQIVARHGNKILLEDGTLNRAKLREIVFSSKSSTDNTDNNEQKWLNALLHPLIREETRRQIERSQTDYVLWVVPLLFENKLQSESNRVLVVDVDPILQISRATKRDNVQEEQVQSIINAQVTRETRLRYADDIIKGDLERDELKHKVAELHQKYIQLAAQNKC